MHRTIVISISESLSSGFDLNEYLRNLCMKSASVKTMTVYKTELEQLIFDLAD